MSEQPNLHLFFEPGRNTVSPTQETNKYKTDEISEFVERTQPCIAARHWLASQRFTTLAQAWDTCNRTDWMLWAVNMLDEDVKRKVNRKLRRTVLKGFYFKPEGLYLHYMTPEHKVITPDMIRQALEFNPFEITQ